MLQKLLNIFSGLRANGAELLQLQERLSNIESSVGQMARLVKYDEEITPNPQNVLEFCRVRDVHAPERGTGLSAGYDFFLPNDFGVDENNKTPLDLVIAPGESVLVPTGVHVKFPAKYVFIAFNKSGIAAKMKLVVGSQVIDADYQGQMHINLHNIGKETQTFKPGQKLTQFILLNVALLPLFESSNLEELYGNEETERGTGGFSSTGLEKKA